MKDREIIRMIIVLNLNILSEHSPIESGGVG